MRKFALAMVATFCVFGAYAQDAESDVQADDSQEVAQVDIETEDSSDNSED